MIKLIVYRLVPIAASIGIFTTALSPLQPALDAFGKAASALAGETQVGGVVVKAPDVGSALARAEDQAPRPSRGKRLQDLADALRDDTGVSEDPYGHAPGARAVKPIAAPGKKKTRKRRR